MSTFLSEKAFAAIGRVAVFSASVDMELADMLRDLVMSSRAELLVAGQPFSYLKQALPTLAKEYLDEQRHAELLDLVNRATALHMTRDLVIHGWWLPKDIKVAMETGSAPEHYAFRPRRWRHGLHGQVISTDDLDRLARDLKTLTAEIERFRRDHISPAD